MPIRFRCQDCRSRVKVPEGTQGKQVKCPRCGRIQAVPRHQDQSAHPEADSLTVHTLVGSMHKAPKRKESLVGAGVGVSDDPFVGGGVSGGLDIPDPAHRRDIDEVRRKRISRKQRRKMQARARMAEREREEALAREAAAHEETTREDDSIAESRRRVEDLFATAHHGEAQTDEIKEIERPEPSKPERPAAIALGGNGQSHRKAATVESAHEPRPEPIATGPDPDEPAASRWTLDLTGEAYPFLRIIPWVLRITALMLIGPAFKVMLVAGDRGFSGVVCLLILFAGLSLVVVTWTVGEIATAVRDIALRRAAG